MHLQDDTEQKPKHAEWVRVTRNDPCQVCKKPDFCTYSPELGMAHCMRVPSERASKNKMGGWIHLLAGEFPKFVAAAKREKEVRIDAEALWRGWKAVTTNAKLSGLAKKLGVEALALLLLGFVWSPEHNAWVIPMRDASCKIVGLRVRNEFGDKWAVKGSHVGCFYTTKIAPSKRLYVLEGPTDTAAAITMELTALGRPSCMGCEDIVHAYVAKHKFKEVVILADNDAPGLTGADKLQSGLKVPSVVMPAPGKDLREFLKAGGDRAMLESLIKDKTWILPKK